TVRSSLAGAVRDGDDVDLDDPLAAASSPVTKQTTRRAHGKGRVDATHPVAEEEVTLLTPQGDEFRELEGTPELNAERIVSAPPAQTVSSPLELANGQMGSRHLFRCPSKNLEGGPRI